MSKNTFSKLRSEKRLVQEKLELTLKVLEFKDIEITELKTKTGKSYS